ncbi:MAG: hypothetical protein ACRC80_10635, partial [Waterburya sp.]
LVGGNVLLEEGNLTATGGRIELGSVAGVGEVILNQSDGNWLLGYEGIETFGNIRLKGAFVAAGEGSAKIETGNLIATDGAQVFTGTFSEKDGGSLTVNATESIELIGTEGKFRSGLITRTGGKGNAGDLTITTKNLIIRDGAGLSTRTKSQGQGGNLNVNATESIELVGTSADSEFRSGLFADARKEGNAGNLTIETKSLIVRDGAEVSTRTVKQGQGGSLNVNATELIELIGTSADGKPRSGLLADTLKEGGNAGNLTITTERLIVRDGATVSVATYSENGGDGGDLNVNATESIELIGTSADGGFSSSLFAQTKGSGDAGNLSVSTGQLTIVDGAVINNESIGTGAEGNLTLEVSSTLLVDNSDITAVSTGNSGNIFINAGNLQLLHGSQISTNAVNTDGGNIFINTNKLEALNNSDITANAQQGKGGLIIINAQDIFGTQVENSQTPQSDITASSELGPQFNGIVAINNLGIYPSIKLPQEPIKGEVVQSCQVTGSQDQSEFIVTGSGGLPPTPSEFLRSSAIDTNTVNSATNQHNQNIAESKPIVEAQGWIVNKRGNVVLTAEANSVNSATNFLPTVSGCP